MPGSTIIGESTASANGPPPGKQDASNPAFVQWLIHQPDSVHKQALDSIQGTDGTKARKRLQAARDDARKAAFQAGDKTMPGIDASGNGINWGSREAQAAAVRGQAQTRADMAANSVSTDPNNYRYDAAMVPDVGYRPGDKYSTLGAAKAEGVANYGAPINQVRTDTSGLDAQKGVLGEYAKLYSQGGLSDIDRARMEQSRQTRGVEMRGRDEAAMQQAEQQGRFGGNAALVSRLSINQAGNNQRALDDLQTSSLGLQRRDQLLGSQAALGGQIQSANDALDHFNTQGARDRQTSIFQANNQAIRDQYSDQTQRDTTNNATANHGVDLGFQYDASLANKRTDDANDASRFNVSPNQGVRGQLHDTLAANDPSLQVAGQTAAGLDAEAAAHREAQAQRLAAITGTVTGLATAGAKAATGK